MKSIISNERKCYICGLEVSLEKHHIYFSANRKISEKIGAWVYLCVEHHRGTNGVHGKNGHIIDTKLKQFAQFKYEQKYSREEFIKLIGKSYIG